MESNGGGKQMPQLKEKNGTQLDAREKERDIRMNNIMAAKAVSDVVRTSLGPRGMDKMVFIIIRFKAPLAMLSLLMMVLPY